MKRCTILLAGTIAAAAILYTVQTVPPVFIWNASASLPTGLYLLRGPAGLYVGERVVLEPPSGLRRLMARRGYLPPGVPLLKEIAALPGDHVCRKSFVITVNGDEAGLARAADSRARPLPDWQGCRTIAEDEIFVMNRRASGSFDGRYFGPVQRTRVIGKAVPVWTDETGHGEHSWFARPANTVFLNHNLGATP